MATYDINFSKKFYEVAQSTISVEPHDANARRVVAYVSRLSMELSLKSFLEQAGLPVKSIKKHWHDLNGLLSEVDKCEVEIEISPNNIKWVSASRVRSLEVKFLEMSSVLGIIIEAENHGASKYPNELRYGEMPADFPPEALAQAAEVLNSWVKSHSSRARTDVV
jgi:hypothetical protein